MIKGNKLSNDNNLIAYPDATSGDWLTLDQAAKRMSVALGQREFYCDDVLKAGYIKYEGMPRTLQVYAVAGDVLILRRPSYEVENLPQHLRMEDDVLRLPPRCVEVLLLGRPLIAGDNFYALASVASTNEIEGWERHHDANVNIDYWVADMFCVVSCDAPYVVSVDDIRIDGEDLNDFINLLKTPAVGYSENTLSTKIEKSCSPDDDATEKQSAPGVPVPSSSGGVGDETTGKPKGQAKFPWVAAAKEIAAEVVKTHSLWSHDQIGAKVSQIMDEKHAAGDVGMVGRGGKVPAGSTIKRRALKGIKL